MNIIEELYYGNVDPQKPDFQQNSEICELMNIISENETKLTKLLSGESKHLFFQMINTQATLSAAMEQERFITG